MTSQSDSAPSRPSRRTFLTVGGVGLAALVGAGGGALTGPRGARAASHPAPGSGGIPPGPSTFGWNSADLLDIDLKTLPWAEHLRCPVPRAERIAPFSATQAHPDLDPDVRLTTLTIDDAGSVYEGRNQPIGLEPQVYTQRYWPYIDVWGSWHGQLLRSVPDDVASDPDAEGRDYGVIDIPNPGWTEAGHRNGARVIGGWFWPRESEAFDDLLATRDDGTYPVADKIVELKKFFGFDGLFINQEATITADQVTKLRELFEQIKRLDEDFYLMWYDAVLPKSGTLDYQNELNEKNRPWLGTPDERLFDAIFLNYDWPRVDPDLTGSAASAEEVGLDPLETVFAGQEHQKGKFNPAEMFSDYAHPGVTGPTSWALFVDDAFWYDAAADGTTFSIDGRASFRDYERKFWSGPSGNPATSGRTEKRTPPYRTDGLNYRRWDGVAHTITERSAFQALPISTSFTIGVGSAFWIDGRKAGERGWNNAGIADASLTWQYWTDDGLTVTLDESRAYEGGHSLAVDGEGAMHLFKTDITQDRATQVEVIARGDLTLKIGVTRASAPDDVQWRDLHAAGSGWARHTGVIPTSSDSIARVSLHVTGKGRLGRITLNGAGQSQAPGTVPRPHVEDVSEATEGADAEKSRLHLAFRWNKASGADRYDIMQGEVAPKTWLGRTSRTVFFAESVDTSSSSRFWIVPVSATGLRGTPSPVGLPA